MSDPSLSEPLSSDPWSSYGERLRALVRTLPFRMALALAIVAVHLALVTHSGAVRYGVPFNAAPGNPPRFDDPAHDREMRNWKRLVVSRWDAGHYINLGLRGYQYCPPRQPDGHLAIDGTTCDLSFYPTYGLLGRLVSLGGVIPIDYALLAISLISSFVFLTLWTGPALVDRLGLGGTYLSLLLFNTFTTGFSLVSVQTEPLTLVLTLGAFVALSRRSWALAGLLAGATSAMRITGAATGLACGLGIVVQAWLERPLPRSEWVRRGAAILLCGWGLLVIMGYHLFRFGDALAYVHAHGSAFHHEISLLSLLQPRTEWLTHSMETQLHEGVWLVGSLLWFALGHRAALRRFPPAERAFWYGLFWGVVAIACLGMNRYLLVALPLFFSMTETLRRRPLALALWLIVSCWHYWQIDVCVYTGGMGASCHYMGSP
jgi:hypothetical protein